MESNQDFLLTTQALYPICAAGFGAPAALVGATGQEITVIPFLKIYLTPLEM